MPTYLVRPAESFGYCGADYSRNVYLETSGAPTTGLALTYSLVGPTGTALVTAQAATEVGAGVYGYTLDGATVVATPGTYAETWALSADQRWPFTFLARYPNGPVRPRSSLRHAIARRCGDLVLGVSSGSNTTTTLKDTNLVQPDQHFRGWEAWIYGGTGRGTVDSHARRITSSAQTGGVLTLGTAWAGTTPDTTSRYELHQYVGDDSPLQLYNDCINTAIDRAIEMGLTFPIRDESVTTAQHTVEYAIPAGFDSLSEVWWTDPDATTQDWQLLRYRHDWRTAHGRVLRVYGAPDGWTLRLVGAMRPQHLVRDDSLCDVPFDWLTNMASAYATETRITGAQLDRAASAQRAALLRDQAERMGLRTRSWPNAVMVT